MKSARKIQYRVIAIIFLSLYSLFGVSQNIAINGTGSASTRPSAILDLSDNSNLGLMLPNVNIPDATVASPVTSPATGLLVWNTNSSIANGFGVGLYYWNGTQWIYININGTSATVNSIAVTAPVVNTGTSLNPVIGLATPLAILYGGVALSSTPSNGQLLIGNGTNYTLSALTAGTGINITNGSGTITIANAGVNSLTANPPIYITGGSVVNVQGTSTDNGGILYSTGAGTSAAFTGTSGAVTGQFLYSNIANAPAFTTAIYPTGAIAINSILYTSSANTVAALAPGTNGQILYSNAGVPTWTNPSTLNFITGSGINNYLARWTTVSNLSTGVIQDNGTGVSISSTALTPLNTLDVNGAMAVGAYAGNNAAPAGTSLIISGPAGIGNNAPNTSAILDLTNSNTTSKVGFLPPSVASPSAITSPATGLIVYNTTTNCLQEYFGSTGGWENLVCECSGLGTGGMPATPGGITGPATACSGATNVAYTIQSVVGATSYTWTVPGFATLVTGNGTAAITVTYTATGTGNITVTATNPCGTSTASTLSVTSLATPGTPGTPSGAAQICQSGGTQTYTTTGATNATSYLWAVSPSGPTLSGIGTSVTLDPSAATAGNYTLTVYGVNGCGTGTVSAGFTVKIIQLTATISSSTNVDCNGNSTGSATVTVGGNGTSPFTYTWSNGASTSIATGLTVGTYTVTIHDVNSCSASTTITLTQPASSLASNVSTTNNVSCNGGANGTVQSSPSGGTSPYTYVWQTGATSSSVSGLAIGTYTITVTDNHGCTATGTTSISQPTALAANVTGANPGPCSSSTNGSAQSAPSGGTNPYTYSWSNGATSSSISSLAGGTYTVTVNDNNNCSATGTVTLTGAINVVVTTTVTANVLCFGNTSGSANASATGGTTPYTYVWSSGSSTSSATGLSAISYTITITDHNGCSGSSIVTITQPASALLVNNNITNYNCLGTGTGSITATASGGISPYTYAWSPSGGNASTATSLSANTYTVTVTDSHGCTATASSVMPGATTLAVTNIITNYNCLGTGTGAINATATGGVSPYTYAWSPSGGTASSATSLSANTYTVTVTDVHGCTATASSVIPGATSLAVANSITNFNCGGAGTGAITATATGGVSPYTYAWSPSGGTASSASSLSANTYTVTVTDVHGCSATKSSIIPGALTANPIAVILSGSTTLTATVSASGGTTPYTYSWAPNTNISSITVAGPTITPAAASNTIYTVTVTDKNGCSINKNVLISAGSTAIFAWTIPAGVSSISTVSSGSQGGPDNTYGGPGAEVIATFPVTATHTLSIIAGAGGFNNDEYSAGGGGGSFIWDNGTTTNPLIAAGGGGGGNDNGTAHIGGSGNNANTATTPTGAEPGGTVGFGATTANGSSCGAGWNSSGANGTGNSKGGTYPVAGGQGGAGNGTFAAAGGFGGGGGNSEGSGNGNSGGGGGYTGGGSSNGTGKPGGGGGSYYTPSATGSPSMVAGFQTGGGSGNGAHGGNGIVTIAW